MSTCCGRPNGEIYRPYAAGLQACFRFRRRKSFLQSFRCGRDPEHTRRRPVVASGCSFFFKAELVGGTISGALFFSEGVFTCSRPRSLTVVVWCHYAMRNGWLFILEHC